MKRSFLLALSLFCVAGLALVTMAWRASYDEPVIRHATIAVTGWPAGARPVTVALGSDLHLGGAMDADRLTAIVDRIAALRPDLALFAGDFVDGHDARTAQGIAPVLTAALRRLRPPLGMIAVLGNHDNDSDPAAIAAALRAAGVVVLDNQAVVRGTLAIGGVGDAYSGRDDLAGTIAALRRLRHVPLLVTHSPDLAPRLPDDVPLLLAGHTHCGQIVLPWLGVLWLPSRYGERYRCGIVRERDRTIIVGAGLGTSMLPLRLGAPPDVWLVRLGPR